MPRQARIDFPGLTHHVIFRGIERRRIFIRRTDYLEFLRRLRDAKGDATIFAWALMPNHVHLLIRTAQKRLPKIMSQILTGYALYFNRKYRRAGHLFQNRYKSIVCDYDAYLVRLVRYIHLNPLKAGLAKNLRELADYPWCGHGAILGKSENRWQEVDEVLSFYADSREKARTAYLLDMQAGAGKEEDMEGGGLIRSSGGMSQAMKNQRCGCPQAYDSRILADGDFVIRVLSHSASTKPSPMRGGHSQEWISSICAYFGIVKGDLSSKLRHARLSKAREACAYVAIAKFGMGHGDVAKLFNQSTSAVSQAYVRALGWISNLSAHKLLNNLTNVPLIFLINLP